MKLQRTHVTRTAIAALMLVAGVIGYIVTSPPAGSRTMRQFAPDRLAELELRMWQAYYAKSNVRLFGLLVTMLHEQYHYPWTTATIEGFHLARAASTFADTRSGYEVVLPDLEAAYRTARNWLHAGFDPRAVARAELAWWVARRTPGANSAATVGGLIADEYALLYEVPRDLVADAALLRAEAAALRDEQAEQPDWTAIGDLLRQSYRMLFERLNETTAGGPHPSGRPYRPHSPHLPCASCATPVA